MSALKRFISSLGNFSVQFNLQVASAALLFLKTYQDVPKPSPPHPLDFAEPDWAKQVLQGIVFAGAFVGMIGMGYLGDVVGRRLGMMATLSLVVVGALGSAGAPWLDSPSAADDTAVYVCLSVFRFVLGAGVGGIYPMAAAMAAEAGESKKDANGEDMEGLMRSSWAFFWQSPGAASPYLVALILRYAVPSGPNMTAVQTTSIFVIGAIPATIVLVATYLSTPAAPASGGVAYASLQEAGEGEGQEEEEEQQVGGKESHSILQTLKDHPEYLSSLIGTAGTWFLYDVAFYGINVFTPDILSVTFPNPSLTDSCWQSLVVSACGIPACIAAIYSFKWMGGRLLNFYGFISNSLAFAAMAAMFFAYPTEYKGGKISSSSGVDGIAYTKFALFCLLTASLNWGPNVATYVCPVQAFPPKVRGTFHGLSAAAGKLGAAVGAFLFPVFSAVKANPTFTGNDYGAAYVFTLQVAVCAAGAVLAARFIPAREKKGEEEAYSELLGVNGE